MDDQPAKQEEDYHPSPKYPFVLFCSSLDHSNGVTADAQRVGHTVQPSLCALQHLALLP